MSVLIQLKGYILPYIQKDPNIANAIIDVINTIDSALDEAGFIDGDDDTIEKAYKKLDAVLIGSVEEVEIEEETEESDESDEPVFSHIHEDEDEDNDEEE